MAASTASMCLRRESLSVHAHISSHDCSRFYCLLPVDGFQVVAVGTFGCAQELVWSCYLHTVFIETRRPRTIPDACSLLTLVRDSYDAAWCVRLLDRSCGFAGDQDDLEIAGAPVLFLDAARELPPFQVEREALGDLAAQHATLLPHRAEAGERGLGVPFQADHDIRLTAGVVAEGNLRRRFPCCLQSGVGSGRRLLRNLRLLLRRVAFFIRIPSLNGEST